MSKIALIDYKIGNLLSVERALKHIGADYERATTAAQIEAADKIILPGVGAFKSCMDALKAHEFIAPIKKAAEQGKPLLGICVGMQMLFDKSHEFGSHDGLGLIQGEISAIPDTNTRGEKHKIPHIGWTAIKTINQSPLLNAIPENTEMYFVHSFTAAPTKPDNRVADAYYGGQTISAIVNKSNIYGAQFHPEKSGEMGLKLLKNFIEIVA